MSRRDNLTPTARATRDRWAVIFEAADIMQAEYDRIESLKARMAQIRKETRSGNWCACSRKLIPVGALAIWQDGVTHRVEGCEADG